MDEITWNEVICLIDRIVHEIRMALSHELYLSALALALTLPDTCGKAEYPNEDYNGVRYKNWCSQYVITDRCDSPYGQDISCTIRSIRQITSFQVISSNLNWSSLL